MQARDVPTVSVTPPAAPDAAVPAGARPAPLATFGADRFRYQLALEPDKEPDPVYHEIAWRFHVRLLDGGRAVDEQSPFSPACGDAEPTNVANVEGADPESQAWRTTYLDKCEVSLAARLVEMGPGVSALLVTQQTGQESVYQLHWLFLVKDGKLEMPWFSPTGTGHVSRVRVLPGAAGQPSAVAYIDASSPLDDDVNTLQASRLHLDGAGRFLTTPLPDARTPLFVTTLGTFKTAKAALKAWVRYRTCAFHYRIFKATLFPRAQARGFLLASVFARPEDVKGELAALEACGGVPRPAVVEHQSSR